MVLDRLLGLYGFKYDSVAACGLLLYLYSYKLVGSVTQASGACYSWRLPSPRRLGGGLRGSPQKACAGLQRSAL